MALSAWSQYLQGHEDDEFSEKEETDEKIAFCDLVPALCLLLDSVHINKANPIMIAINVQDPVMSADDQLRLTKLIIFPTLMEV